MSTQKPLVEDLADVLSRFVVGWEPVIGADLAKHPDVVRVMARYREEHLANPGVVREEFATHRHPDRARDFTYRSTAEAALHTARAWGREAFAASRTVVEWPDGTELASPWRPIDTEETKPWA
jgi:hypothetical protein